MCFVKVYNSTCATSFWSILEKNGCETNHNNNIIKSCRILALHEVSHECVLLRFIIQHVQQTCGLSSRRMYSTIIYEDNSSLFNGNDDIDIQKICSCKN